MKTTWTLHLAADWTITSCLSATLLSETLILAVTLVLYVGRDVWPTMSGVSQEYQMNVMTGSKCSQHWIPDCAATPPSGAMFPARCTTLVAQSLLMG